MEKGERHCELTVAWKELVGRAGPSGRIILKWVICMGLSARPRSRHAVKALAQISSTLASFQEIPGLNLVPKTGHSE
jgi:hypothetical protein